ncbi:MAG: GldG family protein [Kiritimatiellae bacterium]|nr:GldG family protein [Kiritimatiellia bacterium]
MNTKARTGSFWKASGGVAGLLVVLAILIAVNKIIGNLRVRADVTEERLYTLSEGTRKLLGKLEKTVTLKFFCNSSSPEVPVYLKEYAKQVEDLLYEYRLAAKGKILVERYDPKPDSDAEEMAQRYGISSQSLGLFGPPFYFGVAAVCGNSEAVLPVLDPRTDSTLEYNLTRLIYRVTNPKKPVVGVMSSLMVLGGGPPYPMMPGGQGPQKAWLAFRDLREDYEVREIETSVEKIDDTVDVLVVIHPKELSDKAYYAIDQFVLRGGRLLVFVDPFCVADLETSGSQPFMRGQTSSNLGKLFSAWGIDYDDTRVVADPGASSRVRTANNRVEESPLWLSLFTKNFNRQDVLMSQLENLMMPFAGSFSDKTGDNLDVTPLISTSERAGLVSAFSAQFGTQAIRSEFKRAGMALNLAVRITGTFKTAFPDGAPVEKKDSTNATDKAKEPEATHLKEGKSTVVVVGDVDMLYDRFCVEELSLFGATAYRPMNDNVNFLGNVIEQMAGSVDLIGIRSRGETGRPFERVLALQEKAAAAWHEQEAALEAKLRETQQQLRNLESAKDNKDQRFILSAEQRQAIVNFRKEEARIKQELKNVRKNLRRDIEALGVKVKVINIALMPLLLGLTGIGFGIYRERRR